MSSRFDAALLQERINNLLVPIISLVETKQNVSTDYLDFHLGNLLTDFSVNSVLSSLQCSRSISKLRSFTEYLVCATKSVPG